MAGVMLVSFLAALGVVLLVGCICAWLWLPADGSGRCVILVRTRRDLRSVRAYLFLFRCGMIRLPLILVIDSAEQYVYDDLPMIIGGEDVCCFTPKQWEDFLDTERNSGVFGT